MLLIPEKPLPEISSTEIRQQLNFAKILKQNCKYMDDGVLAYIKKNKLYHFNPRANCMGIVK
jgi:nicotinic acid mononucleotide adenylyltransferase